MNREPNWPPPEWHWEPDQEVHYGPPSRTGPIPDGFFAQPEPEPEPEPEAPKSHPAVWYDTTQPVLPPSPPNLINLDERPVPVAEAVVQNQEAMRRINWLENRVTALERQVDLLIRRQSIDDIHTGPWDWPLPGEVVV
jgi:hypothetical protein